MVEAQKYRIEQEMTNLVNELDRSYLRRMQGDMHRCAAKCCDDQQSSLERVHGCIENCTTSLNQANNYVQGEINHLQNRLQRCVMDCNDAARDRLGPDPSQETLQTNGAILKKTSPLRNLPILGGVASPTCGCSANLPYIPDIPILAPLEPACGCKVPNCGCSPRIIEVPTYFSPAVEVPSCGSNGFFSAGVELASCGCGIPSCGCNIPTCGGLPSCGCGVPNCGCTVLDSPTYYTTPACGCGVPNCDCGAYITPIKPAPSCGCGIPTCGCTLPPLPPVLGCTKYLRQVVVQPPFL